MAEAGSECHWLCSAMTDLSGIPQSWDAEKAIVGSVCVDPEAIGVTASIIKPSDFYWSSLRFVYEGIVKVLESGGPATKIEVFELLRRSDSDLSADLIEDLYASDPVNTAHLESHCGIVSDYAALRRTIEVCRLGIVGATNLSSEKPVRQVIDEIEAAILGVQEDGRSESSSARARDLISGLLNRIESQEVFSGGIKTGFGKFDHMTNGLSGGELVIVAGRPSMGKTAFALNVAMNVASQRSTSGDVAVFSLEMDRDSLMQRLLASESRVSAKQWQNNSLSGEESKRLGVAAATISTSSLWIDDRASQTVLDIRAKARRLAMSPQGLSLILVDYLQLMRPTENNGRSREQEVAQMSLGLKALARELDVPVICLSQLSRGPDQRTDKRPLLSDLRESGAIEQDADMVCFLFRPEYYFPNDPTFQGAAELIIAKQRNGPTGVIPLVWQKAYTRFDNSASKTQERFTY